MTRIIIQAIRNIILFGFALAFDPLTSSAQVLIGIEYVQPDQALSLKKIISNTKAASERVTAQIRLGSLYFHDPYPQIKNLNSAMQLAIEAREISSKTGFTKSYNDAQFLIANIYLRKHLPDSAATVLEKVNDSTRVKILLGMSHMYRISNSDDTKASLKKAMDLTLQAQAISRKIHDTLLSVMVRREIACIHSDTKEPNSETELLEIVNLLKNLEYPYLHYTYYELSNNAYLKGNEDKFLFYSEQTLNSMKKTGDSLGAADWFLTHAIILRLTGQHDKSLLYANQAIQSYKVRYGDGAMAIAVRFFAEAMIKLNKQHEIDKTVSQIYQEFPPFNTQDSLQWFRTLGSVYRLIKDYAKAETYHKLRIDLQKGINDRPDYYGLGQLYVEAGQFAKAKPYLYKTLEQIDNTYSIRTLGHLHYCLFLADSATGDYISAIRHLIKNKRYDDTLMKQSKVEAIEKYKTQFETAKKEDSLRQQAQHISLLQQRNDLQQTNLQQADFIKKITIAGTVIALVVIVFLYYQFRRNQRSNKIILQKNKELADMLAEKEWWLKEVHHRVKNNLQTIISLLESQAMYLDKDALQAIEKSQHRIYAMSLIHQKLYQDEEVKSIDMSVYLDEFIGYLKGSFDLDKIAFTVKVDRVHLNLSQAIPVALIINEAITNSIKYAFPGTTDATISVSMYETDDIVHLAIADNGRGFVPNEEMESKSLGIQLIKGLSKEIRGKLSIDGKRGTRITVDFRKDKILSAQQIMQKELLIDEA
jgi:two-component sensor histidine kinase